MNIDVDIDERERERFSNHYNTPEDNFYYFYLKLENCGLWAIICLKLQIKDLKC